MHRVTLILTFLLSLMFSSPSYSEWTLVGENVLGTIIYVDFETIRIVDGYVYYWKLQDFLKPTKYGRLSTKTYMQGDCKLFRRKSLSYSQHNSPMGGGTGDSGSPENPKWDYPPPNSSIENILKTVCSR